MKITNSLKKRFVDDLKLPINILDEPYFEYFLEMYDEDFKTKDKYNMFLRCLNKFKAEEEFFKNSEKISSGIRSLILNSKTYDKFQNIDINKEYPLDIEIPKETIYIDKNVNKNLISIDLEKANFNVFKLLGLDKELNVNNYNDLIKKFTEDEYYLQSKKIRQVIFGELNAKRQQRIQKYIINQIAEKLLKNNLTISSSSSDEVIIENKNNLTTKDIQEILKDLPEEYKFYRVEHFKLSKIDEENNFYVKNINDGEKIEFKNIQGHLFHQVYKKYKNLEINNYDLLFYHEGQLAEFKHSIYDNNNVKEKKMKL